MKTLMLCISIHHENTRKIANAISEVLKAKVMNPAEVIKDINGIKNYDLIGFGSGIYGFKHHKNLIGFVEKLPQQNGRKAFIFSTSGKGGTEQHKELRKKLEEKGFAIVGEFGCKGWDTFGPLVLFGGVNKGKPDEEDVADAKKFAKEMMKK
jgi:flavodoxin